MVTARLAPVLPGVRILVHLREFEVTLKNEDQKFVLDVDIPDVICSFVK